MSWNFSTGLQKALLAAGVESSVWLAATTISLTATTIDDSANGFGNFKVGDWVRVKSAANNDVYAKVLSATSPQLVFPAGTFTPESAGSIVVVEALSVSGGAWKEVLKGGTLHIFSGSRPTDADQAESSTLLARMTLNGDPFAAGLMENGLNLDLVDTHLERAIDPVTGLKEDWRGLGIADGTAAWGRWYANDLTTGASTSAIRMDGIVTTTSGGDIVMAGGRNIVTGSPAVVTNVNMTVSGG